MILENISIIEKIKCLIIDKINENKNLKREVYTLNKENRILNNENEHLNTSINVLNDTLNLQRDFIDLIINKVKNHLKSSIKNKDEESYNIIKKYDKEGYDSYYAAKKILDISIYDYFLQEDCLGMFEYCDGFELLKWLEIAAFGENFTYKIVGYYEVLDNYEINYHSDAYKNYKKQFYETVIDNIINSLDEIKIQEIIKDGLFI